MKGADASLVVLISLALASCNASDQGSSAPRSVGNACSLVTKAEAEAALGRPLQDPAGAGASTASMCQYLAADGIHNVTLQLHPGAGASFDGYVRELEASLKVKATPVASLGEKAVTDGDRLIVLHDKHFFIVTLGSEHGPAERQERETTLARAVLSRL